MYAYLLYRYTQEEGKAVSSLLFVVIRRIVLSVLSSNFLTTGYISPWNH